MVVLAILTGLATGVFAVALIFGIRGVQNLLYSSASSALVVVPATALGGLLVGLLARRHPEVAGGGVTPVMTAIALHGGRIRLPVAPLKLLASAISLGTGVSGGREGPIVQIGGAAASALGRRLAVDDDDMRTLIAAGAGAGIAASFNAPLTGIFFAIEIVIGGYRIRSLQTVVITCVVASVTARELVGASITYQLANPPTFGDVRELAAYAVLGVSAALVGVAFARAEHMTAGFAHGVRIWPPLTTAVGAGLAGVVVLIVPEVFGSGAELPSVLGGLSEPMQALLRGDIGSGYTAAAFGAALLVGKLVATSVGVGTGSSVGSFAPALFIGASLGASMAGLLEELVGAGTTDVGGLALVGAAAVLAASARAPLTAILLAFELTNDYAMVLPLMLATGISMLIADRIDKESIYTRPLVERGIIYSEPQDLDLMQTVTVAEVMTTDPATVPASLPLSALLERFAATGHHGFAVVEASDDHDPRPKLFGVVTITDVGVPGLHGPEGAPVTAGMLATRPCVTVTGTDPVFRALRRMAAIDVGRLPVVATDDHSRLVGMFRRNDLVKAYQRAVLRSLGSQQRQVTSRLRDLAGVVLVELRVGAGAPAADRALREIAWPPKTTVASIRRGDQVVVPAGDTTLRDGDEVIVLADSDSVDAVRRLISSAGPIAAT